MPQTSGSIAVFDEDALRYVDFARHLAAEGPVPALSCLPPAEANISNTADSSIAAAATLAGGHADVLGQLGEEGEAEGGSDAAAAAHVGAPGNAGCGGRLGASPSVGALARAASLARAQSAAKRVTASIFDRVRAFLESKKPGQVGSVQAHKAPGRN
jgi:hypothetical protein